MHKEVKVADVVANPFRNMSRYPINKEKKAALIESMDRTGFWDNVVCRYKNGKYELAYGHHRWVAYKEKYGTRGTIRLIVKELSDDDMLKIMADENREGWVTSSAVDQETIRAAVVAYSKGKINLPELNGDTRKSYIRYAPSFLPGRASDSETRYPYTAESLAEYFEWWKDGKAKDGEKQVSQRLRNALKVLEEAEQNAIEANDPNFAEKLEALTDGLRSNQAKEIVTQFKKIKKTYEQTGLPVGTAIKKALADVKVIADAARDTERREQKGEPTAEAYDGHHIAEEGANIIKDILGDEPEERLPSLALAVDRAAAEINTLLDGDALGAVLKELKKYKNHPQFSFISKQKLTTALNKLAARCAAVSAAISPEKKPDVIDMPGKKLVARTN